MEKETRLIDVNAKELVEKIELNFGAVSRYSIKHILATAPTVDAVEVVRCVDCKNGHPELAPNGGVWCDKWNHIFSEYGFCSLGEINKELNDGLFRSTKIEPCPYCRRHVKTKHSVEEHQTEFCYISCDCGLTFGIGGKDEKNLIDAWNNGFTKLVKRRG